MEKHFFTIPNVPFPNYFPALKLNSFSNCYLVLNEYKYLFISIVFILICILVSIIFCISKFNISFYILCNYDFAFERSFSYNNNIICINTIPNENILVFAISNLVILSFYYISIDNSGDI